MIAEILAIGLITEPVHERNESEAAHDRGVEELQQKCGHRHIGEV